MNNLKELEEIYATCLREEQIAYAEMCEYQRRFALHFNLYTQARSKAVDALRAFNKAVQAATKEQSQ